MDGSLGERVRALRLAKRLTQTELAQVAGVSQGTVSDIENDRYDDTAGETLVGLAAALSTTATYLKTGDSRYRWPESLTDEESTLVEIDRSLSPTNRAALRATAEALLNAQGGNAGKRGA